MNINPLFIGISILHHRNRSSTDFFCPKSSEYYSSISEESNTKRSNHLEYGNSSPNFITGREFKEGNFLPSDFSISSIREQKSILTLTDSNEYRANFINLQPASPALVLRFNEPYNNPSLFKKNHKLHLVNEEKVENLFDKENYVCEHEYLSSERKENSYRKRQKQNNSISLLRENQWLGLKTSRIHSPVISKSNFKHLYS